MYRKVFLPILMISILPVFVACSSTGKHSYKQDSEGHTDSDIEKATEYKLKKGQKGIVTIGEKDYAFDLLRINSQDNVTISLKNGKKYHLPTKSAKSVQFDDDLAAVTFELYRVVQDAAIILVRIPPHVIAKAPEKTEKNISADTSEMEKIRLNLTLVQDTLIKLSLDGQLLKKIPLPQGTQVNWEAKHSVEIELPESPKAILKINDTLYKTSENENALHLFVNIKEGKLIVEIR